jgi:hypothetical protein
MVRGDGERGEIWTADELGLIVMTRSQSATLVSTRILRNITLREPDSSLFAVPSGYVVSAATLSGPAAFDILARKEVPGLLPWAAASPDKAGPR